MRALFLALLLTIAAYAAGPQDGVKEAAEGWTQGAVKQDAGALKRYLAEDLQYAHAGGQLQNKEEYIRAVTTGPARYESFTFSDWKVVSYGKAAVLTAFVDVKLVGRDSFRVRTLQVYVENNGQWQMAAHQSTRLNR
ncbi:MAG: nuclear transport factor 2 family protein [Bryobacterales bacterium]|nr:nuclear transport factor 2 family protein [Bryobacterales bacterium]